jgi:mono/diheme cytochrome c family protein
VAAAGKEKMPEEKSSRLKELLLIVLTTVVLFSVVYGLALVLRPGEAVAALPEAPASVVAAAAPPPTSEPAKQGAGLFGRNCAHCHGDDAKGDEGPSLYDLTKSDERITRILKEGIKGEMPKFGSKFSDADIQALIAFLRTLKS